MKKIPTAEEFIRNSLVLTNAYNKEVEQKMIEFAKLHVEAALKAASEKAKIINDPDSYCGNTGSEYPPDQIISKDSILNSYLLDLIK